MHCLLRWSDWSVLGGLAFFLMEKPTMFFDIFTVIEFTSCIGLPSQARAIAPYVRARGSLCEQVTFERYWV